MNESITLDEIYYRLKKIDWVDREESKHSHLVLVKEYIRRVVIWDDYLNLSIKNPFFDLSNKLYPGAEKDIDKAIHIQEFIRGKTSSLELSICVWYLLLYSIPNEIRKSYNTLPDMYEPLIKIFERKGYFYLHHGYFYIGSRSFPLSSWPSRIGNTEIDISDEALDKIDLK